MNIIKPRIPDAVKEEMNMRIKNKIDISDLIAPYSIRGEDLTGAIIKTLNRVGEDISNLNLTNAIMGEEGKEIHISRANAKGCCFKNTKFLGKVVAKKTDFTGSNFCGAYIPICDYRFAILRNCNFCGTVFTISAEYSYGSKVDVNLFKEFGKMWNIRVEELSEPIDEGV